ncbi:MAG TPA: enoyl-CoA hydratase/isomerase family protein [Spirochaetota bacterium]|nr:enoyl-CoA hydratase/isomerase family protein [Spirochaetota bacterium]
MNDAVLFEQKEMTAILTINRPKANQLSHDVINGLKILLDKCSSDKTIRVVVITAAGNKVFCGGADLSEGFGDLAPVDFLKRGQDLFNMIADSQKPVIAAINGHALGGGCELALACHLRVLKKGARIGLTETNLGIIPGYGGTLRLPKLIGETKALEYILLGRQMEAERAIELGLVNRICKDGDTLDEALELADELAGRPPLAVKAVLKILSNAHCYDRETHLKTEREELAELFGTKDMIEGISAFAQKREPDFRGE